MTDNSGIALKGVEALSQIATNLPPSVNNSPFLYAAALTSVMCIACLGAAVTGWMLRDTWRDRYLVHPKTLMFNFRMMIAFVGAAAFVRAMPEVLYLQMYGDPQVSNEIQAAVTTAKRLADTFALWLVLMWMLILVVIYPHICLVLKGGPTRVMPIDNLSVWPRIVRPFFCFVGIALIAMAFAYAKVYGS